jgi:hypothetical protein
MTSLWFGTSRSEPADASQTSPTGLLGPSFNRVSFCSHGHQRQKSERPKQLRAALSAGFATSLEDRADLVRNDDDEAGAVNVEGWREGTRRGCLTGDVARNGREGAVEPNGVTGSVILAIMLMARLLCLLARERAGRLQKPSSRSALEAVDWVCSLDLPPAGALKIAPTGLLGPSCIGDLLQLARRKGTGAAGSRAPR